MPVYYWTRAFGGRQQLIEKWIDKKKNYVKKKFKHSYKADN